MPQPFSPVDTIITAALARNDLYNSLVLTKEEFARIQKAIIENKKLKKDPVQKYSIIEGQDGHKFAILGLLAKGAQGTVKVAQSIDSGKFCLVKVIRIRDEKKDDYKMKEAHEERKFLSRKQQLVSFTERSTAKHPLKMYTFMEICPGQTLDIMTDNNHLPMDLSTVEQYDLFLNILRSLEELQTERIIHRDLHGGNVLVDRNNMGVSIIDWGLALEADEKGYCNAKAVEDIHGKGQDIRYANGEDVSRISDYLDAYISDTELKSILENMRVKSMTQNADGKYSPNVVEIHKYIKKIEDIYQDLGQAPKFKQ